MTYILYVYTTELHISAKALKRSSITKVLLVPWEILNVCQQAGEIKTFMAMVY